MDFFYLNCHRHLTLAYLYVAAVEIGVLSLLPDLELDLDLELELDIDLVIRKLKLRRPSLIAPLIRQGLTAQFSVLL